MMEGVIKNLEGILKSQGPPRERFKDHRLHGRPSQFAQMNEVYGTYEESPARATEVKALPKPRWWK